MPDKKTDKTSYLNQTVWVDCLALLDWNNQTLSGRLSGLFSFGCQTKTRQPDKVVLDCLVRAGILQNCSLCSFIWNGIKEAWQPDKKTDKTSYLNQTVWVDCLALLASRNQTLSGRLSGVFSFDCQTKTRQPDNSVMRQIRSWHTIRHAAHIPSIWTVLSM